MGSSAINSDLALEKHFTVKELSTLWSSSRQTITRWFEDEPGVLVQEGEKRRGKQTRKRLLIPESVAVRVHRLRRLN